MLSRATRDLIKSRLAREVGRIDKVAPWRVALTYPSPYSVGMSSLGFQQIYRLLQALPGVACERVFLPDGADHAGGGALEVPVSYEGLRPLGEFPLIAFSVAYELELAGLLRMLDVSGIPVRADERGRNMPLVLAGGPLTFSNPVPLAPFVDAIVMGEAENVIGPVVQAIREAQDKDAALDALAQLEHVYVPRHHGPRGRPDCPALPSLGSASDECIPAKSVIITPDTELANMFLIEAERGCSRTCTYCVMRRSSHGGMRKVPKETILDAVPAGAEKVGLVGAAVSDHPQIVEIVNELAARNLGVGLSSLRPDRLKEPFVFALKRAGYRTLTTALDGASERLRDTIERRGRVPHYESLTEHARAAGMQRVKLYLMVGLPSETDDDIDECVEFVGKLSRTLPIALGIAPFCSKRRTPLDGREFAGIDVVQQRLKRLERGLKGRADVRSTSAKWAWVEFVLAQGAEEEGLALWDAVRAGGSFADYRKAFERFGYGVKGAQQPRLAPGAVPNVQSTLSRRLREERRALPLVG
ncbi:MAG TPA: radical SAM protein [Polyangiaceae bacterium]|nr:radical SAM protein [Polyangiaceae bacterium]